MPPISETAYPIVSVKPLIQAPGAPEVLADPLSLLRRPDPLDLQVLRRQDHLYRPLLPQDPEVLATGSQASPTKIQKSTALFKLTHYQFLLVRKTVWRRPAKRPMKTEGVRWKADIGAP